MIRTTVTLPDDLHALIDEERRRTDDSASGVVRRALAEHFGVGRRRKLPFRGLGPATRCGGSTSHSVPASARPPAGGFATPGPPATCGASGCFPSERAELGPEGLRHTCRAPLRPLRPLP